MFLFDTINENLNLFLQLQASGWSLVGLNCTVRRYRSTSLWTEMVLPLLNNFVASDLAC